MNAFYRVQDAFRVTLVPSFITGALDWSSFKHLWRTDVATFQRRCPFYCTSLQTICALSYNTSNQHRSVHAIQKKSPRQAASRGGALSPPRGRMILISRGCSPNWVPLQHSVLWSESVLSRYTNIHVASAETQGACSVFFFFSGCNCAYTGPVFCRLWAAESILQKDQRDEWPKRIMTTGSTQYRNNAHWHRF